MLYTNLKHIETSAQHADIINRRGNIMVIWGRMEPKSITVYRIAEELVADYPNVEFYDLEYDNPGLNVACNLHEFSDLAEIPYNVYYKNGKVIKATSGIQTKAEIKDILDNQFTSTEIDQVVSQDLSIRSSLPFGCNIKSEVKIRSLDLEGDDRNAFRW
jgi:thioredoxin 1